MLNVFGLAPNSIVDGPGIRFSVFLQGCPHHCPGCHNPNSWPFEGGTTYTVEELFARIRQEHLVQGVTLSGGEPFAQAEEAARLAMRLRQAGYEVASYTGYVFEDLLAHGTPAQRELLNQLDILVDGPFLQDQMSLELAFRGSTNQRILNVPKSLAAGHGVWEQKERWILNEVHPED